VSALVDRSSRPQRLRQPTSDELVAWVEALRGERWAGDRIARQTGLSRATVSRVLRRLKLNRMRDLEPPPVVQRYEHEARAIFFIWTSSGWYASPGLAIGSQVP
jgi:hypothetical protein